MICAAVLPPCTVCTLLIVSTFCGIFRLRRLAYESSVNSSLVADGVRFVTSIRSRRSHLSRVTLGCLEARKMSASRRGVGDVDPITLATSR
jgi:hypothetical protein